jgi:hypothetical protein
MVHRHANSRINESGRQIPASPTSPIAKYQPPLGIAQKATSNAVDAIATHRRYAARIFAESRITPLVPSLMPSF